MRYTKFAPGESIVCFDGVNLSELKCAVLNNMGWAVLLIDTGLEMKSPSLWLFFLFAEQLCDWVLAWKMYSREKEQGLDRVVVQT